jgi:hypothetical protein
MKACNTPPTTEVWFDPLKEEEWTLCSMPLIGWMLWCGKEVVATGTTALEMLAERKAEVETRYAIRRIENLPFHLEFEAWLKDTPF